MNIGRCVFAVLRVVVGVVACDTTGSAVLKAILILPAHLPHPGNWTLSPLREL